MPQYVNLGMVDSGCSKIDEGINQFTDAKNCITEAMALLDHNSLRFGGVNSTLEEQLEILKSQLDIHLVKQKYIIYQKLMMIF